MNGQPAPAMATSPYLLNRHQAADRYGISIRGLEELYRRHRDFPVVRLGRKVLIHRERADQWFTDYIGAEIDME